MYLARYRGVHRDWSITLANPNVTKITKGWWAGPIRVVNQNVVVSKNAPPLVLGVLLSHPGKNATDLVTAQKDYVAEAFVFYAPP